MAALQPRWFHGIQIVISIPVITATMNFIHKNAGSLLLLLLALLTGCQKKEFDAYYSRPDNLAQPIYQQLASRGNFKHLLALIDKAGYKTTLSTAGYWT